MKLFTTLSTAALVLAGIVRLIMVTTVSVPRPSRTHGRWGLVNRQNSVKSCQKDFKPQNFY